MNADPQLDPPSCRGVPDRLGGLEHVLGEPQELLRVVVRLHQQPGGSHVAVTDGLNLSSSGEGQAIKSSIAQGQNMI